MSELKVVVNVSKGSPLTGNAWVDISLGADKIVERAEVTAPFNSDPNLVDPNKIEVVTDTWDGTTHLTLTVLNHPESIGPIQTYTVEFYLDGQQINLNWQQAAKVKPLRFGGQPNVTITNPHIDDPKFNGWCSVPDISPGMSITWGLADLVPAHPTE
jgi:hypothetical protein